MLDLHYYGIIHPFGTRIDYHLEYQNFYIFYMIVVNIAAFYFCAFLSSYPSEQARQSRVELKELSHEMFALLGRIERQNKVAAGAYTEFMTLSLRGELTAAFLERLYRRMHESAEVAPPLLPFSKP